MAHDKQKQFQVSGLFCSQQHSNMERKLAEWQNVFKI